MIKMHDIFNKHGSTYKLPRPRPTDIVYVINDGYATFQTLILIKCRRFYIIGDIFNFSPRVYMYNYVFKEKC